MSAGGISGAIVIAIGIVVAAIAFALVGVLFEAAETSADLRVTRLEEDIRRLETQVETAQEDARKARADTARILEDFARMSAARPAPPAGAFAAPPVRADVGEHQPTDDMTEVMQLGRERFNTGITQPGNAVMLRLLGRPRDTFSQDCKGVTNPKLAGLMETRQIGPLRVRMIKPALASLERIMARLKDTEPDIYAAVGTAGALCARNIRGSRTSISNHSWGTAVDITLENRLDRFADGGTQIGLVILAELFNDEGWYWGATYSREDSMHFEVGVETLEAWAQAGKI